MLQEEARQRSLANLSNQPHSSTEAHATSGQVSGRSYEIAAKAAGVGASCVLRAQQVRRGDPALFEQVKAGKVKVETARMALRIKSSDPELYEQLKQGKLPQRRGFRKDKSAPFVVKNERGRLVAEAQKRKMIEGLCVAYGMVRGLGTLDVMMIAAVCDQKELAAWSFKAQELGASLQKFAGQLRRADKHAGKTEDQGGQDQDDQGEGGQSRRVTSA